MESLATKASDEPEQYAAVKAKADEVASISNDLDSYLESIKTEMMATVKADDIDDYEVQDQADFLDKLFLGNGKLEEGGQLFVDKVNGYRTEMTTILSDTALAKVQGRRY